MRQQKYIIEKQLGNIPPKSIYMFLEDINDMQELEFWESRLEKLQQDHTIAYRSLDDGTIVYSIFVRTKGKDSRFK